MPTGYASDYSAYQRNEGTDLSSASSSSSNVAVRRLASSASVLRKQYASDLSIMVITWAASARQAAGK